MFTTIEQVKAVVAGYLNKVGRGGFVTGTVTGTSPLRVRIDQRLEIPEANIYAADGVIGLRFGGDVLRPCLKEGDGVLLLCRPQTGGAAKYILLDRIQPYTQWREVKP